MFFLKTLHKELQLHPKYFGPHLKNVLQQKLIEDVEGTSMGKDGYVITVTKINNIGENRMHLADNRSNYIVCVGEGLIEDSGIVNFQISYDAILFLPFKNEVMDATVTHVNQFGFYAQVGPLQVLDFDLSPFQSGLRQFSCRFSSLAMPCQRM